MGLVRRAADHAVAKRPEVPPSLAAADGELRAGAERSLVIKEAALASGDKAPGAIGGWRRYSPMGRVGANDPPSDIGFDLSPAIWHHWQV